MQILRLLLAALAGLATFYAVLWACTFFDPIATFQSAWHNQSMLLTRYHQFRPYPATILFDLTDFALGMNWLGVVIIAMSLASAASNRSTSVRIRWLLIACAIQPVVVAVSGMMQSETLRVWNFMLPLSATAAGVELARWKPRARHIAYACMFIVLLALGQNLAI